MPFNPFLNSEVAAKRAANKAAFEAYAASRPRVANIDTPIVKADDLLKDSEFVRGSQEVARMHPPGRVIYTDPLIDDPNPASGMSQTIVKFGNQTPEQNAGVYNLAQPQVQEVVRQPSNRYERTDALNQFFKPNAIGWGESPVPRQRGSLPFIKSNLNNPRYSEATMASTGKVLINGEYRDIDWRNAGKNNGGAQPYVFAKDSSTPVHLSELVSPQQYQDVMAGANVPLYMNQGMFKKFLRSNDPYDYKIIDTDKTGDFKRIQGKQIADGDSILPTQGEVWGIGQELNDINKAQEQALRTRSSDSINTYWGSNDEPGLLAIDAVARDGGSGTWVADNQEPYLNYFSANKQSQGASMVAGDLARGGQYKSAGGITSPTSINGGTGLSTSIPIGWDESGNYIDKPFLDKYFNGSLNDQIGKNRDGNFVYRNLVEQYPNGVDRNGNVIYRNPGTLDIGGVPRSKPRPTDALPDLTQEDFVGDRVRYSADGKYLIDAPRNLVRKEGPELEEINLLRGNYLDANKVNLNLLASNPMFALGEAVNNSIIKEGGNRLVLQQGSHPGYYDGTRYIPKGVTALTPASEFLSSTPQVVRDRQTGKIISVWEPKLNPTTWDAISGSFGDSRERSVLRFPTTPETPLTLAAVNDYGIAEYPGNSDNAYRFPDEYQGRKLLPLSVQRNNGTLDPTQLSSRGRWMGGGLSTESKFGRKNRTDDNAKNGFFYNPLESQYLQIQKPPGSDYLRLRSDTDPLTLEAIAADTAARKAAAEYQEAAQVNPFTRQYKITETGNEIAGTIPTGQIEGVTLPVMFEEKIKGGSKFEPDYMPYAPSLAPLNQSIGDGLTILDQHLADARIAIDGARYPLTPEATTTKYLPSTAQLAAEKTQLHGKTRVGLDDKVNWWNQEGPSDADLAAIANGGNLNFNPADDIRQVRRSGKGLAPAYADPSIAPTDIVSAIEAKQQELNRTRALITNYAGSSRLRSQEEIDAIKGAYRKTPGLGATYGIGETVPIDKVYYPPSPTAQPPNYDGMIPGQEDYFMMSPETYKYADLMRGNKNLQRFVTGDEANNLGSMVTVIHTDGDGNEIQRVQRPANSFVKKRQVVSDDGTAYEEDVEYANQKDLADIFDGTRRMTVPELQQRAAYLQNEIDRATSAHNELMGMEAAPRIQITTETGKRRAANLAEEMEQIGLAVKNNDEGQVVAIGSLPIGLPSERSVNLPVKYNSQEIIDPEVQAMVDQGKADTLAAQRLIDFNQQYHQSQRPKPVITETHQKELADKVVSEYYGDQLANMLMTPSPDTAANRVYDQWNIGRVKNFRRPDPLYPPGYGNSGEFLGNAENLFPTLTSQPEKLIDQQLMTGRRRKAQTWGQEASPESLQLGYEIGAVEDQGGRFRGGRVPQFPQLPPNPNRPAHFMIDDVVGGPAQRPRIQDYDQSYLVQPSPSNVRYGNPRSQGLPQPLAPTPTGIPEPSYVTVNDLLGSNPVARNRVANGASNDYLVQPQSSGVRPSLIQPEYAPSSPLPLPTPHFPLPIQQYQIPGWALPTAGGVYLAAAGLNEYQRQQEQKRQQDEAGLRRLYGG